MFKMLPERIEDMLTFFDACGYNTGSSRLSQNRKVAILIHFVHFSVAVFFSLCLIHSTIWLLPAMRFVGLLNYVLQISTAIFTYWFIIFDSLLRWQKHQQFWRIFQKTYESYSPQCSFKLRLYLIKFVQFFSASPTSIRVASNGCASIITAFNDDSFEPNFRLVTFSCSGILLLFTADGIELVFGRHSQSECCTGHWFVE